MQVVIVCMSSEAEPFEDLRIWYTGEVSSQMEQGW